MTAERGDTLAVKFNVIGTPAQQGSKKHVGGGRMVETAKGLAPWRATVAAKAAEILDSHQLEQMDGPLHLTVAFRFQMPASRKKAQRDAGTARKVSAPDLDKLVRAVGDALTESGLIRDDARICEITASKHEVTGWTGCSIEIERLSEEAA